MAREVIFGNEYFDLVREQGVGMNNTPWKGLNVFSKGIADKHVVSVKLRGANFPEYNGTPVVHTYKDAVVGHGMRMAQDTLRETEEYIKALTEAVKFAEEVNNWLFKNDYHA